MFKEKIDIDRLNKIIKKTIESVSESKIEMKDIAESAKRECVLLEQELQELRHKVRSHIEEVDKTQQLLLEFKKKLAEMSKNFNTFNEADVKKVYETASQLQTELAVKREQEHFYIKKRNELEIRIKDSIKTVRKADNLISHIGVVLDYLSNDLNTVGDQLEDIKKRRNLAFGIIKAQEDERQRVSRDIHDGPAQLMSNAVMKAELCERLFDTDQARTRQELQALKKVTRECLQDLRKIIYDLRPMSLDDLGLVPTLERYITDFSNEYKIITDLKVKGSKDNVKPEIAVTMFRIVQEALNNVRKHSNAANTSVAIEFTDDNINLLISDNGVGFQPELLSNNYETEKGFGLLNMRERVELLKGTIKLRTELGKGTRIIINIPYNA